MNKRNKKKKGGEIKKSAMTTFEKITLLISILTLIVTLSSNLIMIAIMLRG